MRPSNKRSRSKQNRPRTLGNIVNRVFDSSGPEGKVRGTPQQIIDKYALLARDAQLSGDRVAAENFLQHAEHYTRMLNEAQAELARETDQRRDGGFQQNGQQGQNRRFDGEGESEGTEPEAGETRSLDPRQNEGRPNEGRQNEGRQDNRQGDGRANERTGEQRGEQPRGDGRPNEGRPNDGRQTEGRQNEGRQDWKERRNKRFEDRRARREGGDPRDEGPRPATAEAESMLVETPESRAVAPVALRPEPESRPEASAPAAPVAAVEAPAVAPGVTEPTSVAATEAAPDTPAKPRARKPRKPRADAAEGPASDAAE